MLSIGSTSKQEDEPQLQETRFPAFVGSAPSVKSQQRLCRAASGELSSNNPVPSEEQAKAKGSGEVTTQ